MSEMAGTCSALLRLALGVVVLAVPNGMSAQEPGAAIYAPPPAAGANQPGTGNPKAAAAVDLTGTWVSVITEDWVYRMVTPRKGDYGGVPLNADGRRVADTWDPAKDEAAGEQCKGHGAVGMTRLAGNVRFSWQDDNTLKMEAEAGNQTRLLHFGAASAPTGPPTWQGYSRANWQYAVTRPGEPRKGNLRVVTTLMRPGYSRKNGVPYSANAQLTEYFHVNTAPDGQKWLSIISELTDPRYYSRTWVVSSDFKNIPDSSPWKGESCSAK